MTTTDLQRNHVLVMDAGNLTIADNGPTQGWAKWAIKVDQLETEDGYSTLEIAPSELRDLRDFLNKKFPLIC